MATQKDPSVQALIIAVTAYLGQMWIQTVTPNSFHGMVMLAILFMTAVIVLVLMQEYRPLIKGILGCIAVVIITTASVPNIIQQRRREKADEELEKIARNQPPAQPEKEASPKPNKLRPTNQTTSGPQSPILGSNSSVVYAVTNYNANRRPLDEPMKQDIDSFSNYCKNNGKAVSFEVRDNTDYKLLEEILYRVRDSGAPLNTGLNKVIGPELFNGFKFEPNSCTITVGGS